MLLFRLSFISCVSVVRFNLIADNVYEHTRSDFLGFAFLSLVLHVYFLLYAYCIRYMAINSFLKMRYDSLELCGEVERIHIYCVAIDMIKTVVSKRDL